MIVTGGVCTAVEQCKERFAGCNISHLDELVQKEQAAKELKLAKRQSSKEKKEKSPFDKLDAWELVLLDNQKSLIWCEKHLRQKKAERALLMRELDEGTASMNAVMGDVIAEYEQSFLMTE